MLRIGNLGPDSRKVLLWVKLDLLPRRIPEDDIEAAAPAGSLILRDLVIDRRPKDIGKGEVPVKEAVLGGEAFDLGEVATVDDRVRVLFDLAKELLGDRVGMLPIGDLLPDKRRAPGIGKESAKLIVAGADELFPAALFLADAGDGVVTDSLEFKDGGGEAAELDL